MAPEDENQPKEEDKPSAEEFVAKVHGEAAPDIPYLGADIDFEYTEEDLRYIIGQRPFFQMLNVDATFEGFSGVEIIEASTGWKMHFLIDALSASCFFTTEESGKGTPINQAFLTAVEAVQFIKDKWPGVHIVDGDEVSQWAIWVACQELNLPVIGFDPADPDLAEKKRQRLKKRNKFVLEMIQKGISPGRR